MAWRWRSIAADTKVPDNVRRGQFKTIPLEVGGRVFVATSLSQVAAIDAGTGDTLWLYDPESWRAGRPANEGFQHRGVAWWTDGEREHSGDPEADEPEIPPEISVYDKETGEYLGGIELPDTPHSNLISYEHGGRQYLAVATGGGRYYGGGGTPPVLVALALPREESGS